MLAIGLILILLAVGGGAYLSWLALQTATSVTLSGGGISFGLLPITLFASGAIAVILLGIGTRLAASGLRRKRAQRRELKELRQAGGSTTTTTTTAPTPTASGRPGPTGPDRAERVASEGDVGLERRADTERKADNDRKADPRA
ncbi:hypothetical protein [Lapillicoccus sp.]|uniref:hypothetical protein n=1 Tax=Lapillicoccus sp. TaxID=1909287 RepID=UPI0039838094